MSTENDKGLDDLFKNKLEDPVNHTAGFNEGDWDAMEQILNKHRKSKGIVYLLPLLSAIAALLLLFLGWWFLQPKPGHNEALSHVRAVKKQQPTNIASTTPVLDKKMEEVKSGVAGQGQKVQAPVTYAADRGKIKNDVISKSPSKLITKNGIDTGNYENTILNKQNNEILTAVSDFKIERNETITAAPISSFDLQKNAYPATGIPEAGKVKIKPQAGYRPRYALSVLAAPDVNGVGSFQQAKVGTNLGMLFSMGVSKKLTISAGAIYSIKPYITPFADYHTTYQFKVDPVNVTADCRMLDIPLNVGYQVYHKQQNKISVGTGLSSYNYAGPYPTGPASYSVPNSNKYFFGVLNLNATYEHQINSKVGISVEPYLKLPLTNIGYSQVRLQTTGLAVGLSWNLNSLSKP
jgi:hypothetical protein